jgi:Xaa-Pro aminopeptidase
MNAGIFEARRRRVLAGMGERAVLVMACAPSAIRNNDVEHDYRQDSDLFYLTGLDEPGTVLVLSTAHKDHRFVLFVRPRNPEREIWDGARAGVDGAMKEFGADAAFPIDELDVKLGDYVAGTERLHFRFGLDRAMDARIVQALDLARRKHRHGLDYPTEIVDPGRLVHEHRLHKSKEEIALMRRAGEITREAHAAAMRVAKPGAYEYEVEAEILRVFRAAGSERPAYGPIVGSGPNATILHHRKNDRRMNDGELLLIDAGAEHGYYASDVTRTFPVNGRFSEAQRAIYDVVLRAQLAVIDAIRPGATLDEAHDIAVRETTAGLVDLGLVEGPLEDAIRGERYKPFFMHRTSHWLGMDVHDVGTYYEHGAPRKLAPGMVLTVEPGVYIGANADVDPKWRGIGVRIEDDILVTENGSENLTAAIPKDPKEIERALAAR